METPFRNERKFLLESITGSELKKVFYWNPGQFKEIYQGRWVNNIYFDTPFLKLLKENIDGIGSTRTKIRLRWYGPLWGEQSASLEFKIKSGNVNKKHSFDVGPISIHSPLNVVELTEHLHRVQMPEEFRVLLKMTRPVMLNRYYRQYFLSFDQNYRLTLDEKQSVHPILGSAQSIESHYDLSHLRIVEMKYGTQTQLNPQEITNAFPFRLTRSSKYTMGMSAVLGRVLG